MNAFVVIGLVTFGAGVISGAVPEKAEKYLTWAGAGLVFLGLLLKYGLDVKAPRFVKG